jgi:hypothetical protein
VLAERVFVPPWTSKMLIAGVGSLGTGYNVGGGCWLPGGPGI